MFIVKTINRRYDDIDSTSETYMSTKTEADKLCALMARTEFESLVDNNPLWKLDEEGKGWFVWEDSDDNKWSYDYEVEEAPEPVVYEKLEDTLEYKWIERYRKLDEKNNH